MRSAMVYVPLRYRPEIERLLHALSPQQSSPWVARDEGGGPGAFVSLLANWQVDLAPEQFGRISSSVGPEVLLVQIDLSGRATTSAALKVVVAIAGVSPGVALDDYSEDLWPLSEIAAGTRRDGRQFLEPR